MSFNPLIVNSYSIDQLFHFIVDGQVSFDDLRMIGLNYATQDALQASLLRRKQEEEQRKKDLIAKEQNLWKETIEAATVEAFNHYIKSYEQSAISEQKLFRRPVGIAKFFQYEPWIYMVSAHVWLARRRIREIQELEDILTCELLYDMKEHPYKYRQDDVKLLLSGVKDNNNIYLQGNSTFDRFLGAGFKLSEQVLTSILPKGITMFDILQECVEVSYGCCEPLDSGDATDIHVLGDAYSGKSMFIAGVCNELRNRGFQLYPQGEEFTQRAYEKDYYNTLCASILHQKCLSGGTRFASFHLISNCKRNSIKLKFGDYFLPFPASQDQWVGSLGGGFIRKNPYCQFVDCLDSYKGDWAYENLQWLNATNKKLLFFLFDYSILSLDDEYNRNELCIQRRLFSSLLNYLTNNGPDSDRPEKGCSFSRTHAVAIVLTKCDLMPVDNHEERLMLATHYLEDKAKPFISHLSHMCERYGINKANAYRPYVFAFSMGEMSVGNTYKYDGTDSKAIADFIISNSAIKKRRFPWRLLFK